MIRVYIFGAMLIALMSGAAFIFASLRSERDEAFARGHQAGRAEVMAEVNQQAQTIREKAQIIQMQSEQLSAQLVPLQKTLEDEVHAASDQVQHGDRQCLDRNLVRALNLIGERAREFASPP